MMGEWGGSYIRLYFHKTLLITLKRIFINICLYLPTSNGLSREFSYVFTHIPFLHHRFNTHQLSSIPTFAQLLEQRFRTVNSYLSSSIKETSFFHLYKTPYREKRVLLYFYDF